MKIDKIELKKLLKDLENKKSVSFSSSTDEIISHMDYLIENKIIKAIKYLNVDGGGIYENIVIYPNALKQLENLLNPQPNNAPSITDSTVVFGDGNQIDNTKHSSVVNGNENIIGDGNQVDKTKHISLIGKIGTLFGFGGKK